MIQNLFRLLFVLLILLSIGLSLTPLVAEVPMRWNDKLIHAFAYFSLILSFDFSWRSGKFLIVKAILVLAYSGLIEYAQGYVPGRHVSEYDMFANAVGIGIFILMVPIFKRVQLYQWLRLA